MKGKIASLAVVLASAPTVAVYEGVILNKYADVANIPTACAGETDKNILALRDTFSRDECMALLGASLYKHALEMDECIDRPVTHGQAKAIVSWAYNVGTEAACSSTLVRKLNAGAEFCSELGRWVYATVGGIKIKLPGLVKRREGERAWCESE